METLFEALTQSETLVFGHRGARAYAPMNTLPSFELAIDQGAVGVELDVRMTADHKLVIIHDSTVNRTTNGQGNVSDLTFRQIRAFDAGHWFDSRFDGAQIPTLDEVFEAIGQRVWIDIEIKAETVVPKHVEQMVAQSIARFGLQERVMVSSFNPIVLRNFRGVMPEIMLGFLHDADRPFFLQSPEFRFECDVPRHDWITPRYMDWANANGLTVSTWTVNDPERAVELRDLGVKVIITDQPDTIIAALER